MPFVIPYQDFVDVVDGKKSELTLVEIPIEDLNKAVGFSYRWLPHKNATAKVTYLPHEFTVETGINADLTCLKAAVKRNPADFYWMDCLCVPQDPEMPQKLKEIANMRLYYSNFRRVVFVGTLSDPNKPELAEFEVISLKNCSQVLTDEQMQKLRAQSGPDFEEQVAMIGEPRILSEDGWKIVNNLNNAFEQGFSLNSWHTRAWTVQEVAVAREIEFMGMLGDQKDISHFLFTCDWTRGLTDDGLRGDSLMDGLMTPIKMMEQNEMTPLMFNSVLTERQAFFADDIFYAILPLLDETVSGLNHIQMWDKVRLKYQHALLGFATQFPGGLSIWTADPYWFGMHNRAVTKKVSPKYETKALVEANKATLNWTIGDRKYTIVLNVADSNVLEGKAPVSIKEGHAEETEAWKMHVFTHKDAVTQGNANS